MGWFIKELSDNNLNLLKEMKVGDITRATQKSYRSRLGYYLAIWSLRDMGLIEENGFDKDRKKFWTLTGDGEEIVDLILKVEDMLRGLKGD